uniref:Late embryogenesis abundant protein LEA-2 subgroup domain-containing protein n=3 Tax=Triticinae TaxID=1648030 RepID=A0A453JNI5_AEGTS
GAVMATAAGSEEPEPKPTLRAAILAIILTLCVGGLILGLQKWDSSIHLDPSYSVRLTEVHGLDPARSPVIRPDFNLELRVDNKGVDRTCKEEITVTVFYGDMVVGWADVPDFCVGKQSSTDVNVKLSHTDVLLTDTLRRRLASELRSGELEFVVEMRMVIPVGSDRECADDYCTSRQSFLHCRAKPGQDYVHRDLLPTRRV